MKHFTMAIGFALLLGACGGGIEGEMTKWKDKMCACKDAACAESTMDDYRAWTKSKRDEAKKMSKGDIEKLENIEKELKACRRKLRDGAAPPAGDPPAGDPPAGN